MLRSGLIIAGVIALGAGLYAFINLEPERDLFDEAVKRQDLGYMLSILHDRNSPPNIRRQATFKAYGFSVDKGTWPELEPEFKALRDSAASPEERKLFATILARANEALIEEGLHTLLAEFLLAVNPRKNERPGESEAQKRSVDLIIYAGAYKAKERDLPKRLFRESNDATTPVTVDALRQNYATAKVSFDRASCEKFGDGRFIRQLPLCGMSSEELLDYFASVRRLGVVYESTVKRGRYMHCSSKVNGAYQRYSLVYVYDLPEQKLVHATLVWGSKPPKAITWRTDRKNPNCTGFGSWPPIEAYLEFRDPAHALWND